MMRPRNVVAGIAGALLLGAWAMADEAPVASSNPYQGIIERNVFALKDPPPPPDPNKDAPPPAPKFYLTGITTILGGQPLAIFKSIPVAGKADKDAKEESYMLNEGQRKGDVEVVSIDKDGGIVKLVYAGTAMTLDFTNNAAKAVAVAAPLPGAPPGVPPGIPGFTPPGAAGGARNPAHVGRQPADMGNQRRPIRGGNPMGMVPGPTGMGGVAPSLNTMAAQPPADALTREQQEVLMEAMRSDPTLPPLPPTSLTPLIQAENQQGANTTPTPAPAPQIPQFNGPLPPIPGRLY